MTFRKRLSSRDREKLWDQVCAEQQRQWPLCNICGGEIGPGQLWDDSHHPRGTPAWLGGTERGVAHRPCNRHHGAKVVTPAFAKSNRTRQRHIGARVSANPLPGGRDDKLRKRMDGRVEPR